MTRTRSLACLLIAGCVTLALTSIRAQTPAAGVEGTWRGTLAAGAANLRLVLRISKAADGLHTGALESLDQGSTIPVDSITVTGDTVRVVMKAVSATFEGTLNAGRTELKGTFTQGAPLPLTFTRDATTSPPPAIPGATSTAPVTEATFPLGLPLDLRVPVPPTPFEGNDGKWYLVYELHIANFSPRDLLLKRLDVMNGATTLGSYADQDLNSMLSLPGVAPSTDRRTVLAGRRAVAFLWITLESAAAIPSSLRHRLTVGELIVTGAPVAMSKEPPVVIGPPLRGAGWMAGNGPGSGSGHRRALIATEGGARIAQRFAIDWVQFGPDGQRLTGNRDEKENKSYRAYGADVLAVADATVFSTKDGIPENIPGPTSRAVAITSETVGGNYVVLGLWNAGRSADFSVQRFAFYAHLQPGSVRVKVGDRVTRGQVLGLLGNSGNSTEPHLHFQISDGASPLGSEGLPYSIAGMKGLPLLNARVDFGK